MESIKGSGSKTTKKLNKLYKQFEAYNNNGNENEAISAMRQYEDTVDKKIEERTRHGSSYGELVRLKRKIFTDQTLTIPQKVTLSLKLADMKIDPGYQFPEYDIEYKDWKENIRHMRNQIQKKFPHVKNLYGPRTTGTGIFESMHLSKGYTDQGLSEQRLNVIYDHIFENIIYPKFSSNRFLNLNHIGAAFFGDRFGGIVPGYTDSQLLDTDNVYYILNHGTDKYTVLVRSMGRTHTHDPNRSDSAMHCITWLCLFHYWNSEIIQLL